MDDTPLPELTLEQRIQKLNITPSPAIVAKVQELHSATVTDATIRRAWRMIDKEILAEDKKRREAEKSAREARLKEETTPTVGA